MMPNITEPRLNLARKWRSKNFDELVGQDLAVKILRNSLYLNHFFPVYLFSGQRGCGKTSAARIFATAVNCLQLEDFQKNPKQHPVPCLSCLSCTAMKEVRHPDFIEIDAASYTGVDNIRNIIESSSFLPVLGRKKIYLIDEAHMLSKSAFNAFLKLLEEPPSSVFFILATTDAHKIIETVKSRCFQLLFNPLNQENVVHHLAAICRTENIQFDESGLQIIYQQSQGSLRDAINLLEQVRFSCSIITKKSIQAMIGQPSDTHLWQLILYLAQQQSIDVIVLHLKEFNFDYSAHDYVFYRLLELARSLIYAKHGVMAIDEPGINLDVISLPWLISFIELLISYEPMLQKSSKKQLV